MTSQQPPLWRRALAELIGTCLLVAVVVGSGIAAQQLSPNDVGLQLLENSTATVLGLTVLILVFGPVSGAHFNPVVSAADWFLGRRHGTGLNLTELGTYAVAQVAGAIGGSILANVMFDLGTSISSKDRTTPGAEKAYAAAFVRGTLAAGIAPTAKHFPGLGRITGNTDVTTVGTTDSTTDRDDPYLVPFRASIAAGAPLVMVSSARYPRLDPDNRAMFSRAVVTGLLRDELGYDGVVITDDVGAAKAVAAIPVGQRATRFIAAGGDIVLTARADQAATMLAAIAAKRKASPAFGAQVDAAAARVLDLKSDLELVTCD